MVNHESLRGGPCEYLLDLETRPALVGSPFHLLAGGRCGRFALAVAHGRWPVDVGIPHDLGLIGARPLTPGGSTREQRVRLRLLRRANVSGHPALLLLTAAYPDGGVHGGHTLVVWNQSGSGYTLSVHFAEHDRRRQAEREALVVAGADAISGSRVQ